MRVRRLAASTQTSEQPNKSKEGQSIAQVQREESRMLRLRNGCWQSAGSGSRAENVLARPQGEVAKRRFWKNQYSRYASIATTTARTL